MEILIGSILGMIIGEVAVRLSRRGLKLWLNFVQ